ncbi:MAG: hypothetical protein WD757_08235 [Actinomycetota bacterium]
MPHHENAQVEFSRLARELLYLGDDSDFELGGAEQRRRPQRRPANSKASVIRETLELRPPDLDVLSAEDLLALANAI